MKPDTTDTDTLLLDVQRLLIIGPLERVDLALHEVQLLQGFAGAPQQRLETTAMLESAQASGGRLEKAALEVRIVRLRKKLERAGAQSPTIKSLRGVGYQLCVPLRVADSPL